MVEVYTTVQFTTGKRLFVSFEILLTLVCIFICTFTPKGRFMVKNELTERLNNSFERYYKEYFGKPFDLKKGRLLEVEAEIRNRVGSDPDWVEIPREEHLRIDLLVLLDERRSLLNWMFKETPEELERMKIVNCRLFELTKELRLKMADVCESLASRQRDDFDDDFEVEGTLKFSYNGEDSILPYDGADVYGSDYMLMIATNNWLTGNEPLHYLELSCRYDDSRYLILNSGNCDDNYSWAHDTPFTEDSEVYVCHTMAIFCRDLGYPAQDVLQLNDFWNEVHVHFQHFATQDKNYKYPRE